MLGLVTAGCKVRHPTLPSAATVQEGEPPLHPRAGGERHARPHRQDVGVRAGQEDDAERSPATPFLRPSVGVSEIGGRIKTYPETPDMTG